MCSMRGVVRKRRSVRVPVECFMKGVAMLIAVAAVLSGPAGAQVPWDEVLEVKTESLESAAQRAIGQQRVGHLPPHPVEAATWSGAGGVEIGQSDEWDATGDGWSYRVTVRDIPENEHHININDRIEIRFDEPMNVREKGTGFALWANAPEGLSEHLRVGVHFKIEGRDDDPVIFSDTPIVHRFGDNPHLLYFDWGYVFDHSLGVFAVPPEEYFESVEGIDLTLVQKHRPRRDDDIAPASGHFYLDGLQLVDWGDGAYDNSRFDPDNPEVINAAYPIVLQARFQQVAVIAAKFGGEEGIESAVRALDMLARNQSWDGSWPEMRTRMQGEYTHGMILADMARALRHMRAEGRAELEEQVSIRHWEGMTRDELYEEIIYRAAKSRSPAPLDTYDDSYQRGRGAMLGGSNRPMTFILGQHLSAQVMTDEAREAELLEEYDINMEMLLEYQGATAEGWPIFGEGGGLSYDSGYTTDHIQIWANASRETDDERWGEIMREFGKALESVMLPDGRRIDGTISARGGGDASLKSGDIVFQEALRHDAPELAQFGYNVSKYCWENWPRGGTVWPYTRSARGYGLGAFLTWQPYDMDPEPEPVDQKVRFPRQWPVWTAEWYDADGEHVQDSIIIASPGGERLINTFEWADDRSPLLSAVPIDASVEGDVALEIHPELYEGNVLELADGIAPTIAFGPEDGELGRPEEMTEDRATITVSEPVQVEIAAADEGLRIRFRAVPRGEGASELAVRMLREIEDYEHLFADPEAADVDLSEAGINVADPAIGTSVTPIECWPNENWPIEHALDGNPNTNWVIGQFLPGSGLRFEFAEEARLDELVLGQGDYGDSWHRAREITLGFSDGAGKQISLENAPGERQNFDLEGVRTEYLELMIDEIYEGDDPPGNTGGWAILEIITGGN